MGEDADAGDNLRGAILHQAIVGGNIGFAFSGVNNQGFNFVAAAAQFAAGRESRAAQSGHAELMNTLDERFAGLVCIITPAVALNPPVFAVGIDNDAHLGEGGGVRGRVRCDGADGTGGRGMNR